MTCKGICVYHKAKKESLRGYYVSGQKRCQACEIFRVDRSMVSLLWKEIKNRPRNMKYKIKMRVINREVMQPLTL